MTSDDVLKKIISLDPDKFHIFVFKGKNHEAMHRQWEQLRDMAMNGSISLKGGAIAIAITDNTDFSIDDPKIVDMLNHAGFVKLRTETKEKLDRVIRDYGEFQKLTDYDKAIFFAIECGESDGM